MQTLDHSVGERGDTVVKNARLFLFIGVCATPWSARADEALVPTQAFAGRYAKGAKVIRVEAFGDHLLVLPLWWGGVQPLDRRTGADFEMQNGRQSVFSFKANSLTISGHRELDGTYQKLGSAVAPVELLLAGQKRSAYDGFRMLGLDNKAILQEVRECLVNIPSHRNHSTRATLTKLPRNRPKASPKRIIAPFTVVAAKNVRVLVALPWVEFPAVT